MTINPFHPGTATYQNNGSSPRDTYHDLDIRNQQNKDEKNMVNAFATLPTGRDELVAATVLGGGVCAAVVLVVEVVRKTMGF